MTDTNTQPHNPSIKEDIYKTQQQIIATQREKIAKLEDDNKFLKRMYDEYQEMKTIFAQNPHANYYQAYNVILTRQNAIAESQRQLDNLARQQARETDAAAIREALEKAVKEESPEIFKQYEDQKARIQRTKDKMLGLATRFYEMTDEEATNYFTIKHKPDESAVKHLINEYLDQNKFTRYQCDYCEMEYNSIGEFEEHCFTNAEDHRRIILNRISDEAIAAMGKATAVYQAAIENAIQAKQNAEYRQEHEQQQAEQARLKKDLPFV